MCSENELPTVTQSVVDAVLELLEGKIEKIILYGSYARNDFKPESDIDIMIILNCSREEVKLYRKQICRIASRIGLEHDIEVSLLLRDKSTFESGIQFLPFYQNIQKEGITLYGT